MRRSNRGSRTIPGARVNHGNSNPKRLGSSPPLLLPVCQRVSPSEKGRLCGRPNGTRSCQGCLGSGDRWRERSALGSRAEASATRKELIGRADLATSTRLRQSRWRQVAIKTSCKVKPGAWKNSNQWEQRWRGEIRHGWQWLDAAHWIYGALLTAASLLRLTIILGRKWGCLRRDGETETCL